MADLVLREADGWEELTEIPNAVRHGLEVGEFWAAVGSGATKAAIGVLEDAGFEFRSEIAEVRAYYQPDAMAGEMLRVWVRFGHRRTSRRS